MRLVPVTTIATVFTVLASSVVARTVERHGNVTKSARKIQDCEGEFCYYGVDFSNHTEALRDLRSVDQIYINALEDQKNYVLKKYEELNRLDTFIEGRDAEKMKTIRVYYQTEEGLKRYKKLLKQYEANKKLGKYKEMNNHPAMLYPPMHLKGKAREKWIEARNIRDQVREFEIRATGEENRIRYIARDIGTRFNSDWERKHENIDGKMDTKDENGFSPFTGFNHAKRHKKKLRKFDYNKRNSPKDSKAYKEYIDQIWNMGGIEAANNFRQGEANKYLAIIESMYQAKVLSRTSWYEMIKLGGIFSSNEEKMELLHWDRVELHIAVFRKSWEDRRRVGFKYPAIDWCVMGLGSDWKRIPRTKIEMIVADNMSNSTWPKL